MKLLNGNTAPRVRSSEGCTVLECGCAYTDVLWLQMCDAEYAEWHARHVTAHTAHKATLREPLP